ncbi:MAG: tail fiber domain-containing protein [Gallionella sp.]|nr:tail fiber domain-containing protein [Gallionella sp.]
MGTKSTTNVPPPTAAETELQRLNAELTRKQLEQIDQLAPFQQQLLEASTADLERTRTLNAALDAAVTPEQQAEAFKAEFERTQRLGPIQDELLQLQLDELRRGGAASPEQLQLIKEAADAGILAGTADIDASTGRGIGLIADELANARGLRLSDSPISGEAALLAREGEIQKGSLIRNLRAGEAQARLNFPLAAQQVQSGINLNQQNVANSAQQFQQQLRQQAFANRLALTGATQQGGIGLASIGPNAINFRNQGSTTKQGAGLAEIGALATGIGALAAFSDRRLKDDYGKVTETKEGIGLHLYKYKGESPIAPLRIGVMADEVKKVIPAAVRKHSSGYDVVDYSQVR